MNYSYKQSNLDKQKAFSLMELLVVIALLTIILGVSLFNYDNFGKDIELENAVYSTALAIRETQVYGINKVLKDVNEPKDSFAGNYGYGIYFNKTGGETDPATNKKFALFMDNNNDKKFDGNACTSGNECYSQIILTKGNYVYDLEYKVSGVWTSVNSLEIYFQRPNPEALVTELANTTARVAARISIKDPGGQYKRCVLVGAAGDITISRNCSTN